jgi:hypothetical protein
MVRAGFPGRFGPLRAPPTYVTGGSDFDAIDWAKPGQNILLQRGLILRGKKVPSMAQGTYLGSYGTGNLPVLLGSTLIATTWTNVSGNVWSTPLAAQPSCVYRGSAYILDSMVKLVENTATPTVPPSGGWGWSAGTLYVNAPIDPNTQIYEQMIITADSAIYVTSNGCTVENVCSMGSTRNGILFALGLTSGTAIGVDVSCPTQDGIDGDAGTAPPKNILVDLCRVWNPGTGPRDGSGSSGDCVSFHGNTSVDDSFSVTIRRCDLRGGWKSGIGNQNAGITNAYRNYLENNWDNLAIYGSPAGTSTTWQHNFSYNICKTSNAENRGFQFGGAASLNSNGGVKLWNNVLWGGNRASRAGIFVTDSNKITYDVQNNIVSNWSRGMDDSFNTVNFAALNNNDFFGNTTNYYDNSTGNLNAKVGAQSITTDPLFVSAGSNFQLQSGSPCINTGANLGLTADYLGNPVPFGAAPDMGAYERQS